MMIIRWQRKTGRGCPAESTSLTRSAILSHCPTYGKGYRKSSVAVLSKADTTFPGADALVGKTRALHKHEASGIPNSLSMQQNHSNNRMLQKV